MMDSMGVSLRVQFLLIEFQVQAFRTVPISRKFQMNVLSDFFWSAVNTEPLGQAVAVAVGPGVRVHHEPPKALSAVCLPLLEAPSHTSWSCRMSGESDTDIYTPACPE